MVEESKQNPVDGEVFAENAPEAIAATDERQIGDVESAAKEIAALELDLDPDKLIESADIPKRSKTRHRLTHLNFITKLMIGFAGVAAATAIIAVTAIFLVWSSYFESYTTENMETLAATAANNIGRAYERSGEFNDETLNAALQAANSSKDIGVMVLNESGDVVFNSSVVMSNSNSSARPDDATQMAIATIRADGENVGSVRVWVYGSSILMSNVDIQFRDTTYLTLILCSIAAVLIASIIGFFFAKRLLLPINKITATAQEMSQGDYTVRTGMLDDDEISRLGRTLDDMAVSIERDKDLERRLTSDVAHELRTPLMAIQSTVEAMMDGVYETDQKHLALVDSEVRRLSRLVDALLKLSRLENRTQPFKREVLNLGKLIEDIVISHEVLVVDSGLSIEYHAQPNVKVVGDPDKIRQAVTNLISNAVRYTSEGGSILVDVHKEGHVAAIDVSDTGIGLTPEEEKMVFSRFWRADAGRNRASGGLGVGLAVVKEIVNAHNGRVMVKGEKGVGSTFTILLPAFEGSTQREKQI